MPRKPNPNQAKNLSEVLTVKNHFGFTNNKLCELLEMNYHTYYNALRFDGGCKFSDLQILKLRINLKKLINNYKN